MVAKIDFTVVEFERWKIFIKPSYSNVLADEESENEDDNNINKLFGRQLAASAEIVLTNSKKIDSKSSDVNEIFTLPMMSESFTWIKGDLDSNHRKLGYNSSPGKRYYWDSHGDMKNVMVSKNMRRNRFFQIMQFIHCADKYKIGASDKAWKITPFVDMIKDRLLRNYISKSELNYDESMIKCWSPRIKKIANSTKKGNSGYYGLNSRDLTLTTAMVGGTEYSSVQGCIIT
ncbi:hypothetical protein ILUMI_05410 [Ignelater luminosus]|uniref:PiggyBac transposable element-derived protein domain-containing protein n=1 Tax=Ignelater luminosus TaxID=2038154 RepID=A0A8K0GDL3_IGNLU|nr:hypothetical protein ILUMI_05410 [Ignelater luminosus]